MAEAIAGNLPIILCFLIGIGLLVAEMLMPGFGVAGISGIVLEIISIVLTYLRHGGLVALGLTIICLAVLGIAISVTLRSASKGRLSQSSFILTESETVERGYSATSDMEGFLGKEGVATTVLRPTGMAEFGEAKLNVVADGEYIPKGTKIKVAQVEGSRVVVRKLAGDASS